MYYLVLNCIHKVTLDALFYFLTSRNKLKQQWPAQMCRKCKMQPHCLPPLLAAVHITEVFFFSAIGIIFSAWNICQQKFYNIIIKGNRKFRCPVCLQQQSERSEKYKTNEFFCFAAEAVFWEPLCSLSTARECQSLPHRKRLSCVVLILNARDVVH